MQEIFADIINSPLAWGAIGIGVVLAILKQHSRPAKRKSRYLGKPSAGTQVDHAAHIERVNDLSKNARTSWFALLSYLHLLASPCWACRMPISLSPPEKPTAAGRSLDPDLALPSGRATDRRYPLRVSTPASDQAVGRHRRTHGAHRQTPAVGIHLALADQRSGAGPQAPDDHAAASLTLHFVWSTFALSFLGAPAVLGYLWVRSWPAHDEVLTVFFCGVPFLFALYTQPQRIRQKLARLPAVHRL